ncbi:MAG: hypothetical protein WDO56_06890 [Gammaproteobacteria bacterium]
MSLPVAMNAGSGSPPKEGIGLQPALSSIRRAPEVSTDVQVVVRLQLSSSTRLRTNRVFERGSHSPPS